MDQKNRLRYEALRRVRDFGTTYGHLFPDFSLAAEAFAVIARCVQDIDAHDVTWATASVSARATSKDAARRALVNRLRLIGRTAKVLPGMDATFKSEFQPLRPGNDRLLLTTARQYRQRVAPLATLFIAHGMPPAFLTDFDGLVDGFEAALSARWISRARVVAARSGIRKALATGLAAMRQIDVIVANHFGAESVVGRTWQRSQHIGFVHATPKLREEPDDARERDHGTERNERNAETPWTRRRASLISVPPAARPARRRRALPRGTDSASSP